MSWACQEDAAAAASLEGERPSVRNWRRPHDPNAVDWRADAGRRCRDAGLAGGAAHRLEDWSSRGSRSLVLVVVGALILCTVAVFSVGRASAGWGTGSRAACLTRPRSTVRGRPTGRLASRSASQMDGRIEGTSASAPPAPPVRRSRRHHPRRRKRTSSQPTHRAPSPRPCARERGRKPCAPTCSPTRVGEELTRSIHRGIDPRLCDLQVGGKATWNGQQRSRLCPKPGRRSG